MRVLVTGVAGFIGFHLAGRLLDRGDEVIGIDNLNDYYEVRLKEDRLSQLLGRPSFAFHRVDVSERGPLADVFSRSQPDRVVHLAAQAGVRYSLQNPQAYIDSNLVGFGHLLECCRHHTIEHLVYASSSSVYGANRKLPFSEEDSVDHPISLYAATKKANELMAHAYAHLFHLPCTGLRFFTVYGPWGRPDMALFLFTRAILEGRPIDVFNFGRMRRDFTYIADIVEGVLRVLDRVPEPTAPTGAPPLDRQDGLSTSSQPPPQTAAVGQTSAPYRVYNIGNNQPVELLRLIEVLEQAWGRMAVKNLLPLQPGDVVETYADLTALQRDVAFRPETPIEVGVGHFVDWYRAYYKVR